MQEKWMTCREEMVDTWCTSAQHRDFSSCPSSVVQRREKVGTKVVSQLSVVSASLTLAHALSQMRKLNNSWVWIQICLEIGIKVFNFPKFKYRLAQRSGLIFKVQSFNDKMCRLGADRLKNGLILLAGIKEKQQKAEAGFSSDKLGNNQDYHII